MGAQASCLLLYGTMGRIGHMRPMVMGQGDCFVGDNGTMGLHPLSCGVPLHCALRIQFH